MDEDQQDVAEASPKDSISRVRETSATQRRLDNFKKLIDELLINDMTADEMGALLKFSPSGTRKYIRDLREIGILELAAYIEGTPTYLGRAVFRVVDDEERLAEFLKRIEVTEQEAKVRKERRGISSEEVAAARKLTVFDQMAGQGRRFHILADDTHYAIRVDPNGKAVSRDPLTAALFGDGPARPTIIET